jgi:hypothetical protein
LRLDRAPVAFRGLILTLLMTTAHPTWGAAAAVDVLSTDLAPLIDKVANYPSRFAVDVPFTASPDTRGEWSTTGATSTWRYSVQIPTAVSMSFHATGVQFPASATLRTTLNGVVYTYSARDIHQRELWSRIGRGDTISFELQVATAERNQLRLGISSLQAGYRGLGQGVRNHRHYDQLRHNTQALTTEADPSGCSENWSCHITTATSGPGQGTVALFIGNIGLCTGVLLNDVPGDGVPYVLTARHCENGNSDGGSPGAASSVIVYWDSVTPCGSSLGNFYDSGAVTQTGATTVVEQQDAWLVRLNGPPVPNDAYYAGWDATGGSFVGGFTPHHAGGTSRQYVHWFGQAFYTTIPAADLSVHYDSTVWATVNDLGSAGPGSSGGGLFDENGRLVGVHVRGVEQSGNSNAGVCPVSSPTAPSATHNTSLATALSGIFNSTADPESTTGAVTLQSVLDPGNTGTKVVDGQTAPPFVSLNALNASSASTGGTINLYWTSVRATSCTASGGESGDGWSGNLTTSGNTSVTSFDGGSVTYTVTCTDGHRQTHASVVVNWALSPPEVELFLNGPTYFGTPFQVPWRSDLQPCTASGGLPNDGWSGTLPRLANGSLTVTETVVGSVTYGITCGSGSRTASSQIVVQIEAPYVRVSADAVTLLTGQPVNVEAYSIGLPCTYSGGTPGDGWSGTGDASGLALLVTETVPGAYTYALSCGSGANVTTAQATVTFVNAAPAASLTVSSSSVAVDSGETFTWDANVRPCKLSKTGPESALVAQGSSPHGTTSETLFVLGTYTYTLSCGSGATVAQATKTVTVTGTPQLTLVQGLGPPVAGQQFLMQWQGNLAPCVASGGGPGDGWAGNLPSASGIIDIAEATSGQFTYTIDCGSGAQELQAQVAVTVATAPPIPPPAIEASTATQTVGQGVTVSWSASNGGLCTPSGGSGNDEWAKAGTQVSSGSILVHESVPGDYTYTIQCAGSLTASSVKVTFNAPIVSTPPVPPSVNLTAGISTATTGDAITLTWTTANASACMASGGSSSDGWPGSQNPNGSETTVHESVAGTYTYSIVCTGAAGTTSSTSSVKVTVNAPTVTVSGSNGGTANGGGSGGGGALGWLELALLGSFTLFGRRPSPYARSYQAARGS